MINIHHNIVDMNYDEYDYTDYDETDLFAKELYKEIRTVFDNLNVTQNATAVTVPDDDGEDVYMRQIKLALLIINLIGGVTNIILIILLQTTRKCRMRAFLVHMCASEAVLLLGVNKALGYILQPLPALLCFIEHFSGILLTLYLLFIGATQINTVMLTRKVSTNVLLTIVYTIAFTLAVLRILVCTHYTNHVYIKAVTAFLLVIVVVHRIYKDVCFCYMRNFSLIGDEEVIRVNIVRIFVYFIVFVLGVGALMYFINGKDYSMANVKIMHMFFGLRPLVILAYVLYARKQLNMQLPRVSLNNIKNDLESTIIISDENTNN